MRKAVFVKEKNGDLLDLFVRAGYIQSPDPGLNASPDGLRRQLVSARSHGPGIDRPQHPDLSGLHVRALRKYPAGITPDGAADQHPSQRRFDRQDV